MKIELPLETWTELFGFMPRSQLVQLVPHIGEEKRKTIGDRQFVSSVQFFLHKCGEVTLGRLHITSSDGGDKPIANEIPVAVVPIPGNVKNFKLIRLSHYDESAIAFLQLFQRNSLLTNVNLCFYNCQYFLLQIMTNFVPLFANINSIQIKDSNVLDQLQSEYSELAIRMLASARILIADYNSRNFWFSDWLRIPREDGKPRGLFLYGDIQNDGSLYNSHFIKHIKKDFLEATQAVTFFIKLNAFLDAFSVQPLTLENSQTQEKLVIKRIYRGYYPMVTISRCPMGTNAEEWIEELNQLANVDNRKIEFQAYSN